MSKQHEAGADKTHGVEQVPHARGEGPQRYIADNDETKDQDR